MFRAFQQAVVTPLTPPGSAHSGETAALLEFPELAWPVALASDDLAAATLDASEERRLVLVGELGVERRGLVDSAVEYDTALVPFAELRTRGAVDNVAENDVLVLSGIFEVRFRVVVKDVLRSGTTVEDDMAVSMTLVGVLTL